MDPPKHAVVVSIDEKSQIQALDRTQPGLPLKPGKCGTMTHDYKRNGTTTLFAALNILDGTVIGRCMRRHRHQEFIRFLNAVERAVPAGKVIHAIVDNYAAHKQPNVLKWLADHPRWTFHFTPTSASWLNAVEGFFSAITRRQIRRGAFHSVDDLQNAIKRYIDAHNSDCRPFVWTSSAKAIFEKLAQVPVPSVLSQCTSEPSFPSDLANATTMLKAAANDGVNGKPAAFDTVLRGATHAISSVANHLHAPTPMPSSGFCVRRIDVVPLFSSLNRAWKQG